MLCISINLPFNMFSNLFLFSMFPGSMINSFPISIIWSDWWESLQGIFGWQHQIEFLTFSQNLRVHFSRAVIQHLLLYLRCNLRSVGFSLQYPPLYWRNYWGHSMVKFRVVDQQKLKICEIPPQDLCLCLKLYFAVLLQNEIFSPTQIRKRLLENKKLINLISKE